MPLICCKSSTCSVEAGCASRSAEPFAAAVALVDAITGPSPMSMSNKSTSSEHAVEFGMKCLNQLLRVIYQPNICGHAQRDCVVVAEKCLHRHPCDLTVAPKTSSFYRGTGHVDLFTRPRHIGHDNRSLVPKNVSPKSSTSFDIIPRAAIMP